MPSARRSWHPTGESRGTTLRSYSPAKVARLLAENNGHLTIRLGRYDAAWMPHPARDHYAPAISGPADEVTYTVLDIDLVKADVIRGDHRWAPRMAAEAVALPTAVAPVSPRLAMRFGEA
jgi:hypothetical protein